ncbi:unnamed protein product [Schistosoma curassoni]|uniref:PDZ domain-containing protein n=1 Tax=Schistosoma curassoni TaxID=6186 RepID=A0A183JL67_9TREM|nr:unnamed protein product [Schistosoma curassoni]
MIRQRHVNNNNNNNRNNNTVTNTTNNNTRISLAQGIMMRRGTSLKLGHFIIEMNTDLLGLGLFKQIKIKMI